MYATDVCKMYTTFQQTFVYILYTKSKEACQLNFVYKMYTNICGIVVYILYTNILYIYILYTKVCGNVGHILYRNILYTFCIYTKCMQNVYKSLSKCGIHFVYNRFVYILYTSILMYKKCTSCIQFVYKIHTECVYK